MSISRNDYAVLQARAAGASVPVREGWAEGALTVFVAATVALDFVRATRARLRTGDGLLPAMGGLLVRHNRRYGGFLVHVGGRLQWDRLILGLPLLGPLVTRVETARFARTLGTMLRSGVPVLGALAVVGDMMSNLAVGGAVSRLADGVKRGGTIAAGMQEHPVFPSLAVHMVRVGEESGRLEEMLLKVADTFEAEVRTELKRVLGLLEPAVILAMGVLVAFIVVAMLLAIFSINEVPL